MMIQTRLVVFAILVIVVPALVMVITVVMIVGVSRLFSLHLIRLRRHPPHEALSALLAVLNAWVKPLLNFHVDVSLLSFHVHTFKRRRFVRGWAVSLSLKHSWTRPWRLIGVIVESISALSLCVCSNLTIPFMKVS